MSILIGDTGAWQEPRMAHQRDSKMAHQDRVHKLPFIEEERKKYMLNLEIQAYGRLHFQTVHNLSKVMAREEAAK